MNLRWTWETIEVANLKSPPVIGQIDALSVWPEGPSVPITGLLWGMGVVALIAMAVAARVAWRRWRVRARPLQLFWQVAGRTGLTPTERWVLWRAARACGLRTPLTLLVCRATLMHHAQRWIDRLPHGRAIAMDRAMQRIAGKLFPDEPAGG